MGRTLKRVPYDFNWPLQKVWGGYLNPFSKQCISCEVCEGTGYSPEAKALEDKWYGYIPFKPEDRGSKPLTIHTPAVRAFAERNVKSAPHFYGSDDKAIDREAKRLSEMWNGQWCHHLNEDDIKALLDKGRLMDFTHVARTDEQRQIVADKIAGGSNSWLFESNGYVPTPEEVNIWSISGFGHDSSNQWICVGAECKRLGVSDTCSKCGGQGSLWPSKEIEKQADDWKETEPPTGEGFQLWKTTSEGSPSSPVFATLDELCEWCAINATTFGSQKATAENWRQMLDEDFVRHEEGNFIFL